MSNSATPLELQSGLLGKTTSLFDAAAAGRRRKQVRFHLSRSALLFPVMSPLRKFDAPGEGGRDEEGNAFFSAYTCSFLH